MRYEAEMIPPLKSFMIEELYLDAVEEEFTAGYGIADIVGIKCNQQRLKARIDTGFKSVANIRELSILLSLQEDNPSSTEELARAIGLSESYIKKKLLKSLIEKGYVERKGTGYALVKDVFSFTDLVVSVEAKLTKWRDALAQAKRYHHFSNIVFVALPQHTVKKINKELFKNNNIGILSVASDSVRIELMPKRMTPKTFLMHLYCNEVFYENSNSQLHLSH